MSPWILFETLLMSAVIYKQAQKRGCAISSKLQVSRC